MPKGCLVISLAGSTVTPTEQELIQDPLVAGVLLSDENYNDPDQLKSLTHAIRKICADIIIMVSHEPDQSGLCVSGFTQTPMPGLLGRIYLHDQAIALEQAYRSGWIIGAELLICGVDLTLAPVLNLSSQEVSAIASGAFHEDPSIVIELGREFIRGVTEAGLASIAKFFPTVGGCQEAVQPFQALSQDLSGVLLADSEKFCQSWVEKKLFGELVFAGAVVSFCHDIENISNIQDKLDAGCHLVIVSCRDNKNTKEILKEINWLDSKENQDKLTQLSGKFQNANVNKSFPQLAKIWEVSE